MHILDTTNRCLNQTFSAAVILNTKGVCIGKLLVRFTNSDIGYNHAISLVMFIGLSGSFKNSDSANYSNVTKGGTYDKINNLINHLDQFDMIPMCHGSVMTDACSSLSEVTHIKHGKKKYKVIWAI